MSKGKYTASLSRTQGRSGFSVIFRHPTQTDKATGKPGLRVRRGLGTRDQDEAVQLTGQLNALLSEPKYHSPSARREAESRFDERVTGIFYDKMVPEQVDFEDLRSEIIPLPESEPGGYRHVLLLGTTGAGKTTLLRQLIGTDPRRERFPSTSTAKTTTCATEILVDDGPWRAVVTFASQGEVRDHLSECISQAVLAAARGAADETVLRRLLNHVDQRFRFSYVLGNGPKSALNTFGLIDDEDDEESEDGEPISPADLGDIDVAATSALLGRTVKQLRELATGLADELRKELDAREEDDKSVLDELFEEELDRLLSEHEACHEITDQLMDAIEKRFDLLPDGQVRKDRQGWPLMWSGEWPAGQRTEFLKAISRFSSNNAVLFGRLLTPLVNGIRVAGPLYPVWADGDQPKLVLHDGEGLGHTPKSSSSVSTVVSRQIDNVDAVVLVDDATQPMQAAPLAAMREILRTGNARKLITAFTHFDEVRGPNLPNASAKAQHVMAAAESVLAAVGEELGPFAERALRTRLEGATFFLADLQEPMGDGTANGRRTIAQLKKLLVAIDEVIERPRPADSRPVYDRMNLVLAVSSAAAAFHDAWRPTLGLESKPGFQKVHWGKVKALTRRLAEGWADEYGNLRPVADLRQELLDRIYLFIQSPLEWDGAEPSQDDQQIIFDEIADRMGRRLLDLSTRRVRVDRVPKWQKAYYQRGTGSTFVRARIVGGEIYEPAVPIPDMTPSPDRNQFLREVIAEFQAAVEDIDGSLR